MLSTGAKLIAIFPDPLEIDPPDMTIEDKLNELISAYNNLAVTVWKLELEYEEEAETKRS